MNTTASIVEKVGAIVGDPIAELESRGLVVDDHERLRIIHELSKHIWLDTPKRNIRLLAKIHQYSKVRESC